MSYIYRFFDKNNKIIYVGRSEYINNRLKGQHFTKNGHLPKSCYDKCLRVEYAKVKSINESRIYELYLISIYNPEYNTIYSEGGDLSLFLPELQWVKWDFNIKNYLLIEDIESATVEIDKTTNDILNLIEIISVFDFIDDISDKHKNRFNKVIEEIKHKTSNIKNIKNSLLINT